MIGWNWEPPQREQDTPMKVTSATRPPSPKPGTCVEESDTGRVLAWTGLHWIVIIQHGELDRDLAAELAARRSGESTPDRLRRVEAGLGSALGALSTAREECAELTRLLLDAREEIGKLETRLAHANGSEACAWRGLAEQLLQEREERQQP